MSLIQKPAADGGRPTPTVPSAFPSSSRQARRRLKRRERQEEGGGRKEGKQARLLRQQARGLFSDM